MMPFDSHDIKPMYSVLLCMLFVLVRFDTHDMLYIFSFAKEFGHPDCTIDISIKNASFDSHDMKPIYSVLLCMLFGLVRFDTHDM